MRTCLLFAPIAIGIMLMVSACGPSKEEQAKMIEEGEVLVAASDCKTCHHPTNKIIGPAHLEVAKRYETTDANIEMLAQRIINGGGGIWGEQPMNAHTDLSKEDAEKMARYVLSLDESNSTN